MAMVMVMAVGVGTVSAGTNEVSGVLQRGLFEEEANRNLDAAIQAYQSVITQTDKDHQFAATAIFRLGECYRKQGKTNEANVQYQRILREFPDQSELVKLSREYTGNSGTAAVAASPVGSQGLLGQLAAAQAEVDSCQKQMDEMQRMSPEKKRIFAQQHFPNPVLNSLMEESVKAEQALATFKEKFGDNHPEVQTETAVLKTIYQQIDAQVDGIVAGLVDKENTAKVLLALLERKIKEEGRTSVENIAATETPPSPAQKEANEIRRLQAMMKDSPDLLNARDRDGRSPLYKAVVGNQLDVAKFLLDNKVDTEAADNFAKTPLILAAETGHKEMTGLLLERGALVNSAVSQERVQFGYGLAKGENGCTPLHYAAQYGYNGVAEVLIKHGAKVDARNEEGKTPLHLAAAHGFKSVVETLQAGGADINSRDNNGATALFEAAGAGNKAIVELLVARGADVNARNNDGKSALFTAISEGNKPIVDLLLSNKADVNLKTKDGFTPLLAAVNARQLEITRLLLKHGADAKAKMAENHQATPGWTALDAAVSLNDNESVKLLLDYHADPNATYDLNDGNHRNSTPLILAAENGQKETAQILLAHKADVNSRTATGLTALFSAVSRDDREMAALLLDNKADTELHHIHRGYTVLHSAVADQKKEMTELLLARGAQVNSRNDEGKTPLHLAVAAGSRPMVELLLAHGADANLKDKDGNTALDLAGNQSGSGNVMTLAGGGSQPLSYQWQFNGTPGTSGTTNDISTLLRQHGAFSARERSTIRITRSGQKAEGIVFRRDAQERNHHTIFEVIAYVYPHQLGLSYASPTTHRDRNPELPGFYFPDFAHVKIQRLEENGSTNILNIDLGKALSSGDSTKNIPLNWGDVVELPELDHNVSENWDGLSQPMRETLKKCLERQVEIVVKGKTNKVTLAPELTADAGIQGATILHLENDGSGKHLLPSFWLRDVVRAAKVLMNSSDLTGLKVKRLDPATGKTAWLVYNLEKIDEDSDLWLQDGDVIEAPEKQ